MTKEIRTLIDLRDIEGIEIECRKCKAKIMIPIASQLPTHDYRCFQCHADWFGASYDINTGAPFAAAVAQINDLMAKIAQLSSKERSDIHVPIRLHLGTTLISGASDRASGKTD
jgi:DNA-directed RNA polymerase subunit RPC12/RpoP